MWTLSSAKVEFTFTIVHWPSSAHSILKWQGYTCPTHVGVQKFLLVRVTKHSREGGSTVQARRVTVCINFMIKRMPRMSV